MDKTKQILQDLIEINNDRIAGFDQTAKELASQNGPLKVVFKKLADDSRSYVSQLTGLAREKGLEPESGTSTSGGLHKAWLQTKAAFSGNDPEEVLTECHSNEHAIQDAYAEALTHPNDIAPELYSLLTYQQQAISEGHQRIVSLLEQVRAGGNDHLSDGSSQAIEQDTTTGMLPGYEKQNIPGMEPAEHFETSREQAPPSAETSGWSLEERIEPFKDIQVDFSSYKKRTAGKGAIKP